jgi:hypothetical protein
VAGLHPDGLAAVYGEHAAAVEVAFAENRSEALASAHRLAAAQQVHWSIHRAFIDYQTAAEERRLTARMSSHRSCTASRVLRRATLPN